MIIEVNNLSEIELVKLYRKEKNNSKLRSKIFNTILFRPRNTGKNWNQNIWSHINKNRNRLKYDTALDENDLYQEILKAMHQMLEGWFDVNSKNGFSTYAWYVINSYVDRVFQTTRTIKRKTNRIDTVEINDCYGENKKVADIITDTNYGVLRTLEKNVSFDNSLFCKDLINFIDCFLVEEDIEEESEELKSELINLIKKKKNIEYSNLIKKYNKTQDELQSLEKRLSKNVEKQMYKDIIKFIQYDVKGDELVAQKYNCSRSQITKAKQKLTGVLKSNLKNLGLSFDDYI